MGRFDVLAAACPTRQIVFRLGEKWTLLALYALGTGPLRFRALQRAVEGISQRMLTQTVRNLERDGLVSRTVVASVPPQVSYALTPLGESLGWRSPGSGRGPMGTSTPSRQPGSSTTGPWTIVAVVSPSRPSPRRLR